MDNYSLSDIAAVANDGCFGGNNALTMVILFALIFGGGGFFGGYRGGEQYATSADVQRGFDTSEITRKLDGIVNGISDATYALNNDVTNEGRQLQTQMANGFCETSRNIDSLRFDMANYFFNANEKEEARYQKLHDEIQQDKIETLRGRINQLELNAAMCGVVRYPNQLTYTAGGSPFCNCNCNSNLI